MIKKEIPSYMEIQQRESDKQFAVWCNATLYHLRIAELKNYSSDWVCIGVFPSYNKAMAFGNTFPVQEKQ